VGGHQVIHFEFDDQAFQIEFDDQAFHNDFDKDHHDDTFDRRQDQLDGGGSRSRGNASRYACPVQDGNPAVKLVVLKNGYGRARRRTWAGVAQYRIQRLPLLWNAVLREDEGRELYERAGRQGQGRASGGRQALLCQVTCFPTRAGQISALSNRGKARDGIAQLRGSTSSHISRQQSNRPNHEMELEMSEISDILQQRAGLSADQAQEVEQVIVQSVLSKVPPEFQGMLSSALGVGDSSGAAPADSGGLGGLMGMAEGFLKK